MLDLPKKTAIVCEGGGIKGAFVTGVLKSLMGKYSFANVDIFIGASSSCPPLAYACAGRDILLNNLEIWSKRVPGEALAPHWWDLLWILKAKGVINTHGLVEIFKKGINSLNLSLLERANSCFVMPVSNIKTAETIYYTTKEIKSTMSHNIRFLGNPINRELFFDVLRASMSPPLFSAPVRLNGDLLTDGGFSCPVPIEFPIACGCEHIVVISTKQQNYVRKNYLSNNFDNHSLGCILSTAGRLFSGKYRKLFHDWNARDQECRRLFYRSQYSSLTVDVIYPNSKLVNHIFPVSRKAIESFFSLGLDAGNQATFLNRVGACHDSTATQGSYI